MSLPPGFLDELRTRLTLSQVVGRKVTWDMRKSNMAKGDWWAPCPFHQEKSASFHVDDRKGFYYCFGCHAKGDALTFVKETENLPFLEAVETLAREAGLAMPARDPQAAQRADRRTQLTAVMDEAIKWFRLQLKTSGAQAARDYLARRGLKPEAQDRWELGWCPEGRGALFQAMTAKGIAAELLESAGLCAKSEHGPGHYDRFAGRIIFPIRDGRGRAISLGGRSLDPNARAKYLNGPETELFDKGRNLFNLGPAREAAGKGQRLVVAEGYMDVIALSEAGFKSAVAPLGTAVTEDQLRLMWKVADEPLIALDGDAAGIRAALRVVDLALPLLEAGKGLRFAILPGGMDPDDLIKAEGAGAMTRVLDGAEPMVRLLWRREVEGRVFDSPERKAALDRDLRAHLRRIADPSIRAHYGEEIKALRAELFGSRRSAPRPGQPFTPRGKGFKPLPLPPMSSTRGSLLAQAGSGAAERLREAVILATCITHPGLIARFETALERLDLTGEAHNALRAALLARAHHAPATLRPHLAETLPAALDALFAQTHVQIAPPVRDGEDEEKAALCLAEELAKLDATRGARAEVEEAVVDIDGLADEGLTWRLARAQDAVHRAGRAERPDDEDFGENRADLLRQLDRVRQALPDNKI